MMTQADKIANKIQDIRSKNNINWMDLLRILKKRSKSKKLFQIFTKVTQIYLIWYLF